MKFKLILVPYLVVLLMHIEVMQPCCRKYGMALETEFEIKALYHIHFTLSASGLWSKL